MWFFPVGYTHLDHHPGAGLQLELFPSPTQGRLGRQAELPRAVSDLARAELCVSVAGQGSACGHNVGPLMDPQSWKKTVNLHGNTQWSRKQ